MQLPSAPPGEILAEQITATGGTITVTGMNFRTDPVTAVTWTSDDGGRTWSLVWRARLTTHPPAYEVTC